MLRSGEGDHPQRLTRAGVKMVDYPLRYRFGLFWIIPSGRTPVNTICDFEKLDTEVGRLVNRAREGNEPAFVKRGVRKSNEVLMARLATLLRVLLSGLDGRL